MQCKQIDNLAMKYFDGNISEIELEQLLRHNQKCPACAAEFEVLRDALFEIEELPELEPSIDLTPNIMNALYSQKHMQIGPRQILCLVLGFVGLILFTYNVIVNALLPAVGIDAALLSFEGLLGFTYNTISMMKEGFASISLALGKILVIRDTILKEHTILIFLWLSAIGIVHLMLYKLMNLKDKKSDLLT